jgi:hypothetical protein
LSGTLATLSITNTLSANINSLITSLAQNYNGFDWNIYADWNPTDGLPQLYLGLYSPEKSKGTVSSSLNLFFDTTPEGGNLLSYSPWPMDATSRVNVVIITATNAAGMSYFGEWDDGRFGTLITPQSQGGECIGDFNQFTPLRRTFTGALPTPNFDGTTLGNACATVGKSLAETSGAPIITHHPLNPDVSSYATGDRCRIRIIDSYLTFDLPGIRIIDRSITDEDANTVASIACTLDFTDQTNPADGV